MNNMIKVVTYLCIIFSLVSCKVIEINENKYIGLTPYIKLNKSNNEEVTYIEEDRIITLIENNKYLCVLLYSSECSACKKLINNILNPYIKETKNIIYAYDVYNEKNIEYLYKIEEYQMENNSYFQIDKDEIRISRPVLQIIENKKVIAYEVGYSINCLSMINAYILK